MSLSVVLSQMSLSACLLYGYAVVVVGLAESTVACQNATGVVLEYCEGQTFSAHCATDEIVLIESAHYGRMRLGRCLRVTHGNLGCDLDVLEQFDTLCSGQRRCDVRVSSIIDNLPDNSSPCTKEFRGYLEASYTCIKVVSRRKEDCAKSSTAEVVSPVPDGYLASVVTEETGCGSLDTPWLVRTQPGQTIQLKLYDFAAGTRGEVGTVLSPPQQQGPRVCQVYAVIKERSLRAASETVCSSGVRESTVYMSATNQIEVRMVVTSGARKMTANYYFMLKYHISGCADILSGNGIWAERKGDSLVYGCNSTTDRWQLKCEGDQWVGHRKNCTSTPLNDATSADHSQSIWGVFTGSQWAVITIILSIATTIGLVIFCVGLLYLKRRRSSLERSHPHSGCITPHCVLDYHLAQCTEHRVPRTPSSSKSLQSFPPPLLPATSSTVGACDTNGYPTGAENDYFRTWQLQRHAVCSPGGPRSASLRGGYPVGLQFTNVDPAGGGGAMSPGSACRGRQIAEHIYESPKFERRDVVPQDCSDPSCTHAHAPLQYYELDPQGQGVRL